MASIAVPTTLRHTSLYLLRRLLSSGSGFYAGFFKRKEIAQAGNRHLFFLLPASTKERNGKLEKTAFHPTFFVPLHFVKKQ